MQAHSHMCEFIHVHVCMQAQHALCKPSAREVCKAVLPSATVTALVCLCPEIFKDQLEHHHPRPEAHYPKPTYHDDSHLWLPLGQEQLCTQRVVQGRQLHRHLMIASIKQTHW